MTDVFRTCTSRRLQSRAVVRHRRIACRSRDLWGANGVSRSLLLVPRSFVALVLGTWVGRMNVPVQAHLWAQSSASTAHAGGIHLSL
jgi:hypothetical protein